MPAQSAHHAPLTLVEAATYLNVTPRYIRRLVAERRIAYHKLGRLIRFSIEDLERFFASGRVEPDPDHPAFGRSIRTASRTRVPAHRTPRPTSAEMPSQTGTSRADEGPC